MIIKKYKQNSEVDPFDTPIHDAKKGTTAELRESNYQLQKLGERVNHPAHYNSGKIEAIDAIWDWGLDFIEGNVVKYVTRSKHKGDRLGDLKKARWYLDYLIDKLKKE